MENVPKTNNNINASCFKFVKSARKEAEAYHQYLYNKEEFMAREKEYESELENLGQLQESSKINKRNIDAIKKSTELKIKNNELNYEYYNLSKEKSNVFKYVVQSIKLKDNQLRSTNGMGIVGTTIAFGIYLTYMIGHLKQAFPKQSEQILNIIKKGIKV